MLTLPNTAHLSSPEDHEGNVELILDQLQCLHRQLKIPTQLYKELKESTTCWTRTT